MKPGFALRLAPINVGPFADTDPHDVYVPRSPSISPPSSPFINRRALSPRIEAELRAACTALVRGGDDDLKVLPKSTKRQNRAAPAAAVDGAVDPQSHHHQHQHQHQHQQRSVQRSDRGHGDHPSHPETSLRAQPHHVPKRLKDSSSSSSSRSRPDVGRASSSIAAAAAAAAATSSTTTRTATTDPFVEENARRVRQWFQTQNLTTEPEASQRTAPLPHLPQQPTSPYARPKAHDSKLQSPSDRPVHSSFSGAAKSDDTRSSTSYTQSTGTYHHGISTGQTSATTMSRTAKPSSRDVLNEDRTGHATTDPVPAGWLRQEIARRRGWGSLLGSGPVVATSTAAESSPDHGRSTNRKTRSFGTDIKNYLKSQPSSSRPISRASMTTINATDRRRSDTSHGWKAWTRHGKSLTDLPASRVYGNEEARRGHKSEVNLNQDLPPLPKIRAASKGAAPVVAAGDVHIVDVMLQDIHSPFMAKQTKKEPWIHRKLDFRNSKTVETAALPETQTLFGGQHDFDELMSAMQMGREYQREHGGEGGGWAESAGPSPTSAGPNLISIESGQACPRNFSRKLSADGIFVTRASGQAYSRTLELPGHQTTRDKPFKGIRKAIGSLFSTGRATRANDQWAAACGLERDGVRTGMMIHEEAASAPIVRY